MIETRAILKGRYRIGRRLGEGGMAIVFAGQDLLLGRDVAIKTLRPQFAADASFRARFAREARAAASLSHPNIIDVFDVGEEAGTPFLVMELVRGHSLQSIIATEAPFHPDDVAELLEQVGGALDYAHAKGYVHRDVKPANILIDEHRRARVVDFGIAKGLTDSNLTETGGGFGTASYVSPEQAEGLMATPASDVYSLGVVAYEMLTGRPPFQAETPLAVAMRHVNEPPVPPSAVRASVPPAVDAVVLRALAKDPTRRWPTAGALAHAMRRWRDQEQPIVPALRPEESPRPERTPLLPTVLAILLVVAALAALLRTGLGNLGGPEPSPTAAPILAEPTITGALEPRAGNDPVIEIEPVAEATTSPTATTAPLPAPTIAPAGGQTVAVPNLRGVNIATSTQTLLSQGLSVALGQTEFSDTIPMNAVVSQDPPAGSLVAPGTTVRVSLSRGPSPFRDRDAP